MEVNNPLYRKQGIHVIANIFTIEKGETKVLLIKRKNKPYTGMWALVGGALYNNEDLNDGMKRELKEKSGITNIELVLSNVFGKVDRSPVMRMVAVSYIGVIDAGRVSILKDTLKTSDAEWFNIDDLPELAYDHRELIDEAITKLKSLIVESDILRSLYPDGFTIPEIQKAYETVLEQSFDRRNFRKKLLSLDLIEDTGKEVTFAGRRPAKLYKFKVKAQNKKIF